MHRQVGSRLTGVTVGYTMLDMTRDPLVSSLPHALRVEGRYRLRRVDGVLGIYLDYPGDLEFDGSDEMLSMFLRSVSHIEDFPTHVDDLDEEMRIMTADFIKYELPSYQG